MESITKHISNPSQKLIELMQKMEREKDERREKLRAKVDLYFPDRNKN